MKKEDILLHNTGNNKIHAVLFIADVSKQLSSVVQIQGYVRFVNRWRSLGAVARTSRGEGTLVCRSRLATVLFWPFLLHWPSYRIKSGYNGHTVVNRYNGFFISALRVWQLSRCSMDRIELLLLHICNSSLNTQKEKITNNSNSLCSYCIT